MNKKTIRKLDLANKRVLIRVDFNIPLKNGVITSDNRIEAALPTIKEAINKGAKVILLSHLGRIKKESDKKGLSLMVVAQALSNKLSKEIIFSKITRGKNLTKAVNEMENGQILMIENTRYEDVVNGKVTNYESKNNSKLAKY
jgi:phosphoglycerate kinase